MQSSNQQMQSYLNLCRYYFFCLERCDKDDVTFYLRDVRALLNEIGEVTRTPLPVITDWTVPGISDAVDERSALYEIIGMYYAFLRKHGLLGYEQFRLAFNTQAQADDYAAFYAGANDYARNDDEREF